MNTFARSFISLCTVAVLLAPSATFASVLLGSASNTTGGSNLLSGLVGYWGLNEGSGSTAYASGGSSSASIALYNSPAWVSGKFGDALSFDGSTQYAESASPSGFNQATSARSMSAWIYITASGTTMVPFVYGSCSPNGAAFGVYLDTSSVLHFWGCGDDFSTGMTLSTGMWYHIVITTLDGSTVTVYVNGVAVDTGTPSVSSLKAPSGTSYLELGGAHDLDPANYYFHGMIDDVRYYNRVLSASEVKQLYQFGAVHIGSVGSIPVSSGLVGYWNMNGNTINWATGALKDTSGQGNNGRLVNMSTTSSPTPGKIGQALSFNGSSQYVYDSSPANTGYSAFTLCSWFKTPVMTSAVAGRIISVGEVSGGNNSYTLQIATTPYPTANGITSYANVGGTYYGVTKGGGFLNNTWYHACSTFDGSHLRLYINGQLVDTTLASGSITHIADEIDLGAGYVKSGSPAEYFNGSIDDVRIYDRALTPAEIALLYALGTFKIGHTDTSLVPNGLVGEWSLDGPTINWATGVVKDVSGNGNDGQLVNMSTTSSPVPGKTGQALSFNGSSQYVDVSNPSGTTNLTGSFTLSAWVKLAGTPVDYSEVVDKESGNSGYSFIIHSNRHVLIYIGNGISFNGNTNASVTLSDGSWYFITATYNGTSATVYVNGTQDGTSVNMSAPASTLGQDAQIGRRQVGGVTDRYFNGSIDDVRIYNRALSAQEIEQLYESGQ